MRHLKTISSIFLILLLSGCYEITTHASGGGSISPAKTYVKEGGVKTFSVTNEDGYRVSSIEGCGGSYDNGEYTTSPIFSDCKINAKFEEKQWQVEAVKPDGELKSGERFSVGVDVGLPSDEIHLIEWSVVNNGGQKEAIISNKNSLTPDIYIPAQAEKFNLSLGVSITNVAGEKNSDDLSLKILPGVVESWGVDAGYDRYVAPKGTVYLSASIKGDEENQNVDFGWVQKSGPRVDLTSSQSKASHFSYGDFEDDRELVFEVSAVDEQGIIKTDLVSIFVGRHEAPPAPAVLTDVFSVRPGVLNVNWEAPELENPTSLTYIIHVSRDKNFIPSGATYRKKVVDKESAEVADLQKGVTYYVKVETSKKSSFSSWGDELRAETSSFPANQNSSRSVTVLDSHDYDSDSEKVVWNSDKSHPEVGSIVISTEKSEPFLREVTSTEDKPGGVFLYTSRSSISKIFRDVSFSYSKKVTSSDGIQSSSDVKGERQLERKGRRFDKKASSQRLASGKSTKSDGPLLVESPDLSVFKPGKRSSLSVKAKISSGEEGYNITRFKLKGVQSPSGFSDPVKGGGISEFQVSYSPEDGSVSTQEATLSWFPIGRQVDLENGEPYVFTFEVVAEKMDCSALDFDCRKEVEVPVSVQLAYREPAKVDASFRASGDSSFGGDVGIGFEPNVLVEANIQGSELESGYIGLEGRAKFDLSLFLESLSKSSSSGEKQLFSRRFVRILTAGPVPIVIIGKVSLDAKYEAVTTAKFNITSSFEETINIDVGVEYSRSRGWVAKRYSDTSYNFSLRGSAEGESNVNVSIVPDLEVSFYGALAGRLQLTPYLFGEVGLEGEVESVYDSDARSIDEIYRFTSLDVGGGVKLGARADFSILDHTFVGWPSTDEDHFQEYEVLPRKTVFGLPEISLSYDKDACSLDAVVSDSSVLKRNGFVESSSFWKKNPDSSVLIPRSEWEADGSSLKSSALFCRTDNSSSESYEALVGGSTELGSWMQIYGSLENITPRVCPSSSSWSFDDYEGEDVYECRYIVNAEDPSIVLDLETGLEWKRCAVGQTWSETENTCLGTPAKLTWGEVKTYRGETGWRLPSKDEIQSIIHCPASPEIEVAEFNPSCDDYEFFRGEEGYDTPTLNWDAFPRAIAGDYNTQYVSSDTYTTKAGDLAVWYGNFYYGRLQSITEVDAWHWPVRLVKGDNPELR